MNEFDFAQELEAHERDSILTDMRQEAEAEARFSMSHCIDCGDEIAEARRIHVKGVKRCVECQQNFETNNKRGLR